MLFNKTPDPGKGLFSKSGVSFLLNSRKDIAWQNA